MNLQVARESTWGHPWLSPTVLIAASQPASTISSPVFLMLSVATRAGKFFWGFEVFGEVMCWRGVDPCGAPHGGRYGGSSLCADEGEL